MANGKPGRPSKAELAARNAKAAEPVTKAPVPEPEPPPVVVNNLTITSDPRAAAEPDRLTDVEAKCFSDIPAQFEEVAQVLADLRTQLTSLERTVLAQANQIKLLQEKHAGGSQHYVSADLRQLR